MTASARPAELTPESLIISTRFLAQTDMSSSPIFDARLQPNFIGGVK
jgi:hypothetical protein